MYAPGKGFCGVCITREDIFPDIHGELSTRYEVLENC